MQLNKFSAILLIVVFSLCSLSVLSLASQTVEINVGSGNHVRTGTVDGGDCVRGTGTVKVEKRRLASFAGIEIDGPFDITVEVTSGKEASVSLQAQAELLPFIVTKVADKMLKVSTDQSLCSTRPMSLTIQTSSLRSLTSEGANDIVADLGTTPAEEFSLQLGGTSSLKISGGGVTHLQLVARESVELDARSLPVQRATVEASGTATVHLLVNGSITGESRDASEIHIWGSPKSVRVAEVDAGEVVSEE